MAQSYAISCNCGYEVKGQDIRMIEAEMWHHAIRDHLDMVKAMPVDQLAGLMKSWDKTFAAQAVF